MFSRSNMIRLTQVDGEPIVVRVDSIRSAQAGAFRLSPEDTVPFTVLALVFQGSMGIQNVMESPEEIQRLAEEAESYAKFAAAMDKGRRLAAENTGENT